MTAATTMLPVVVASTEDAVIDAVRDAIAQETPLRIAGQGTWLGAGRPVTASRMLDLSRLTGVVEYVPGDVTITVRGGTSLAEIDATVREHGQWLPLDPFGAERGSIGATLATASAGPLAASVGAPRDVTLGVAFVTGEGRMVRGGGRVVKNVAGFDLVRLAVGAWGTLGVITEATLRLRALPEAEETLAVPVPDNPAALESVLTRIRSLAIAPLATELVSGELAQEMGLGENPMLLVRIAGNAASVRSQHGELSRSASVHVCDAEIWTRLRRAEPGDAALVMRLSGKPTELARLWHATLAMLAGGAGAAHASVARGVVRCWMRDANFDELAEGPPQSDPRDVRIFERLPAAQWERRARPAARDHVSRAIREAFDPARLLNRGILGEAGA